ncbi:MAG: ATP synthase F0 subunit B [Bryobacteraceae bacterium]
MDPKLLQALTEILLKAIPTIIILVILHNFLKVVLFAPTEKMLKERHALTGGARSAAEKALANAERKTQEYEAQFRDAKAIVYKEQEETRRTWLTDQVDQMTRAKADADASVAKAKTEIIADVATARAELQQSSQTLADQIATSLLAGRKA